MAYDPNLFGASATVSSSGSSYQNATGGTVSVGTPVSVNGSGNFTLVDVSSESSVLNIVGYANAVILNSTSGQIVGSGRAQNITTGYSVGTPVWVGTTPGTLTNVKPDLTQPGWAAGMFVIFAGVIVKNQVNPSNKDLQILTQIIGQLE